MQVLDFLSFHWVPQPSTMPFRLFLEDNIIMSCHPLAYSAITLMPLCCGPGLPMNSHKPITQNTSNLRGSPKLVTPPNREERFTMRNTSITWEYRSLNLSMYLSHTLLPEPHGRSSAVPKDESSHCPTKSHSSHHPHRQLQEELQIYSQF